MIPNTIQSIQNRGGVNLSGGILKFRYRKKWGSAKEGSSRYKTIQYDQIEKRIKKNTSDSGPCMVDKFFFHKLYIPAKNQTEISFFPGKITRVNDSNVYIIIIFSGLNYIRVKSSFYQNNFYFQEMNTLVQIVKMKR